MIIALNFYTNQSTINMADIRTFLQAIYAHVQFNIIWAIAARRTQRAALLP